MDKKKFKWGRYLILAVAGWVCYSWLSGSSGVLNQMSMHQKNKALMFSIDSLKKEKINLDEVRSQLENDMVYLEKVVRMELGMAKPGEKVYKLYKAPLKQND